MKGTVGLHDLYRKYNKQIEFLSIYIREAHPIDGWWLGKTPLPAVMKLVGMKDHSTEISDPKTIEERRTVAGECADSLKYGIRTYVDEMDDAVNKAYAAWPTRLYLIGLDGRVVYHGGLGPYDFRPSKLKKAIEEYLPQLQPV